MLVARLNIELENGGLSENQFGFRQGRSTIDAIQRIYNLADEERRQTPRNRKLCLLLAFDVRNAFNSATLDLIVREMEKKMIPKYLIRIIKSYLDNRKIVLDEIRMDLTAGVPQGSVTAAVLWNVLYDGVLRLQMPEGVHLTAYADDLAMLVIAKNEETLENTANISINKICNMGLQLVPEKTEATHLIGRKKCRPLQLNLVGTIITLKDNIKYLGVILD